MKTVLISIFSLFIFSVASFAEQGGYMVIDSQKIYESVAKYNQAVISLENLSAKYQSEVDAAYENVEKLFTAYQSSKSSLSQSARVAKETEIIALEKQIKEMQENYFGEDGAIDKKSDELIAPVKKAVDSVISGYAKENGYLMVLEKNSDATIIYVADQLDKTQEIIKLLNQ